MFFKSTLISTILLTSAVLADRRYIHRQPQSLKRSDTVYDGSAAGVLFQGKDEEFTFVTFTFTASPLEGPNAAAVMIVVTPDDRCEKPVTAAISLEIINGVTRYQVGTTLTSGKSTYPDELHITDRDRLKFFVDVTAGHVEVQNLTKNKSVHHKFTPSHFCGGEAAVYVTEVDQHLLGHFGTLTLEDVMVAGPSGPYKLSEATAVDMGEKDNTQATTTFEGESTITIYQK
ncbi:hypothetical protein V8E55_003034 [Tylopilus felleus]